MTHTVYARREPTTDRDCHRYCPPAQLSALRDVAIYYDREATKPFARFSPFRKRPTRANKYVNLNCYRWRLEWID